MPVQTISFENTKIMFDKEKTQSHKTTYNSPCNCQDCRNYYKNVESNTALIAFLSDFGIDYMRTEEILSWDRDDGYIHSTAYYGVDGDIEGDAVSFERFEKIISITKDDFAPHDRTGSFFWITVEGAFPYILDEERESAQTFKNKTMLDKLKDLFKKKD